MSDWARVAANWIGAVATVSAIGCFVFIVYVGVVLLGAAKAGN